MPPNSCPDPTLAVPHAQPKWTFKSLSQPVLLLLQTLCCYSFHLERNSSPDLVLPCFMPLFPRPPFPPQFFRVCQSFLSSITSFVNFPPVLWVGSQLRALAHSYSLPRMSFHLLKWLSFTLTQRSVKMPLPQRGLPLESF